MKENNQYMRVTEVLSPFSGLKNIPKEILDNACIRGIYVHTKIDAIISQMGCQENHELWDKYVESFEKWMPKDFINKPDRFFCEQYNITGECDAIYKDQEGLVLVDFKTPVNESKTWAIQGSAYSYLAKKAGYDIKRIEFVKLSKTGSKPKVYVYEENFEMFLKCLDIFKMFFKNIRQDEALDYI